MNALSQKDPRWSSLKINNTQYTMSGWGCFVTACSIVADILPSEALLKLKFDGAMLVWESIKNIGLEPLEKGAWDNAKALAYVQENGQCIARVDFDGSDRTDDTHFVVLIGNKRLYDPWDGKEKATSTYSKYTGIRACRKMTMANELDVCLKDRQKFWDERDAILRELQADSVEGGVNTVRGLRSRITDLTNQLGTAQAEQKNKEEIIGRLGATVLQRDERIKTLDEVLNLSTETITQLGKDKGNLAIEVEQLKIQVETLKQGQAEGSITLTIADLFKLIWSQKITIKKG
jgi:archaellum component FlaC